MTRHIMTQGNKKIVQVQTGGRTIPSLRTSKTRRFRFYPCYIFNNMNSITLIGPMDYGDVIDYGDWYYSGYNTRIATLVQTKNYKIFSVAWKIASVELVRMEWYCTLHKHFVYRDFHNFTSPDKVMIGSKITCRNFAKNSHS